MILEAVKNNLGISNAKKDQDIAAAVAACKKDMQINGVDVIDEADALTVQAIKMYCRAWYDYNGQGEQWQRHYERLRDTLCTSGGYHAPAL